MASSKAKQMDIFLNGLHDSSGQPLKNYKAYFWTNSGASTPKTVWADINKVTIIDQTSGVTLGNKGEIDVYGDGEYYVQIKTPAGALYDSFTVSYSSVVDFGGLYIDVAEEFGTTGTKVQEALDSLNPLQEYTLLFKGADFTIGQDITFPDNVLLKGMITSTINQTSGTITINRTPDLPDFQFFTGSTNVSWGSKVREAKPVWTEGDITGKSVNFYGDQRVNGAQTITGDQSVIGTSQITSSQTVGGNSTITGNQTVDGTLEVTGNQTNSADLTVSGNQTIGGSNTYKVVSKTANYTAANESVILVDASSGSVTINLPAASGLSGREYTIKKIDSSTNIVTVDANGGETIDGILTKLLYTENESVTIICDGTNWEILNDDTKNNYITVTAGEALTANDVIRLSGGMAYKAYSTREIGLYGVVGFVTQTTAINDPAIIAVRYWNGFSGLIAGNDYYIDTNGTIGTESVFVVYPKYFKIGTAISSTTILINFEERSEFEQNFSMIKQITANTPTQMFKCQINDTGYTEGILKIKSIAVSGGGFADGVEKAIVWRGYDADFQVRDNIDIIPEDPVAINTITYTISGGIITFSLEVSYTLWMTIVCENTSKVEMIFTEL